MGTIIDYLDWYGDLDFSAVAFNEVDALVLAQLSYLDMEGIGAGGERGVCVREASKRYFRSHTTEEIYSAQSLETPLTPFLLQGMAAGRRFSRCRLSRYVSKRDVGLHRQFAAACVEMPDESVFVVFRGTDDTLVGWREDFEMGCGRVPAQADALEYLGQAAEAYPGRLLYVAGHSKGGNLTVYASAMCAPQVQGRIVRIYDFDGPGFIAPVLSDKRLATVRKRVTRIVPGYCVVGALFQRAKPDLIVKSEGSGLAQHSAFSWRIKGPGFETLSQREKGSVRFVRVFGTWMDGIPLEERAAHVNEAFDALESTGVATMSEIAHFDPLSLRKLIVAIDSLPPATRQVVDALILALLGNTLEGLASPFTGLVEPEADGIPRYQPLLGERRALDPPSIEGMLRWRERARARRSRESVMAVLNGVVTERAARSAVLLVGGLALMGSAFAARPVMPIVLVAAMGAYTLLMLGRYWSACTSGGGADPMDGAIGACVSVAAGVLLCFQRALTVVFNLGLGACMLAYGIYLIRKVLRRRAGRDQRWWRPAIPALVAGILGVGVLIGPSHLASPLVFGCGAFILVKAVVDLASLWARRGLS